MINQLQIFKDRLMMQNELEIVKKAIKKQQEQYNNSLIFKSYQELQEYRERSSIRSAQNQSMLKPILLKNHSNSILRCKKVTNETTLNEMNKKFGILTLEQKISANSKLSSQKQNSQTPINVERTDKYHNIEGKIARQQRIQMILKFSRISTKKIQTSSSPQKQKIFNYPNLRSREALQHILTISHRKNMKNILPILPTDPESIEEVFQELNSSFKQQGQENTRKIFIKNEQHNYQLPKRLGGGFTQPIKDKLQSIYFIQQ